MASVVLRSLFVAVCLQAATGAELPLEECEPRGALSAGFSDALVCTARGDWLSVGLRIGAGDLWLPEPRDLPDCTDKPGQQVCDTTCSLTGVCLSSGQWLQTQNCTEDDQVCKDGACEDDDGSSCVELEGVLCYAVGTFPSLVDCSSYYSCVVANADALVKNCDGGKYYDACTGQCDIEASGECSWAVSNPCVEVGNFGVAPNNDRLYYVCLLNDDGEIVPSWRKCVTGHFNTATLVCDNNDVAGCGITTNPSTSTTESPTATTTSPSFKCQSEGVNANPATNCSFYYCYSDGSFMLVACRNGYHFELASDGCVYGTCTP